MAAIGLQELLLEAAWANGYTGRNRIGYFDDDLTPLLDSYLTTIPMAQRMEVLGQVIKHLTSNAVQLWLMYAGQPVPISNRLVNVSGMRNTTNVHEWDVK